MVKYDKQTYRKMAKTALKKESKRVANSYKNRLNLDILRLIKFYKVRNLLIFMGFVCMIFLRNKGENYGKKRSHKR